MYKVFTRCITSLLALILLIQPIAPAFAAQGTEDIPLDFVSPTNHNSPQSTAQDTAADGSYRYAYELELPPGRNGLTPDLNLNYASNQADPYSPFGEGWSVSVPYIYRLNKTGYDYSGNEFGSSLDGEIVDQGNDVYHARTENGDFRIYERDGDAFSFTEDDGTRFIFGTTSQARLDDPSDGTRIHTWHLEQVIDTNGNKINHTYAKHAGQIYPDEVAYVDDANPFTVEFITSSSSRSVTPVSYAKGFAQETQSEITRINIKEDGQLARHYDLTYSQGHLKTIKPTGYVDGVADGSILPTEEFTYAHEVETDTWTRDPNAALPRQSSGASLDLWGGGNFFANADDDGRPEFFSVPDNGQDQTAAGFGVWEHSATSTNWTATSAASLATDGAYKLFTSAYDDTHAGEIDGDGVVEFIHSISVEENEVTNMRYGVYDDDGNLDWSLDTSCTLPTAPGEATFNSSVLVVLDTGRDGLAELIYGLETDRHLYDPVHKALGVFTNDGDCSWTRDDDSELPMDDQGDQMPLRGPGVSWRDYTNDGIVDYRHVPTSQTQDPTDPQFGLWVGQGDNTWIKDGSYVWSEDATGNIVHDDYYDHMFSGQFDGDGYLDEIHTEGIQENDETNNDYHIWLAYGLATSTRLPNTALPQPDLSGTDLGYRQTAIDLSKTGVDDLIAGPATTQNGSYHPTNTNYGVFINNKPPHGQMIKVNAAEGAVTKINYQSAHQQHSSNRMPGVHVVVSSVVTDDGFGTIGTTTYEHQDGDYYFTSPTDRRFAGFGTIIETQDDGTILTTKYHQGNGETGNEPTDSYAKIGKVYERTVEDSSNNIYTRERNTFTDYAHGSAATSSLLTSSLTQHYDGDADHKDAAEAFVYDTNDGAVETHTEYGEVNGNADGTFTDVTGDTGTTEYTYATSSAGVVVPSSVTLKDNAGTKVTETKLYYDNLAHGIVDEGNLTKVAVWLSGTTYAETTTAYNTKGQPTSTIDPRGHAETYEYDDYDLYPATTTNALGHTVFRTYDYSSGEWVIQTDANGITDERELDGLDRLTAEFGPDPQTGARVQKSDILYTDTRGSFAIYREDYLDASNRVGTKTYLNGFGDPIQTRKEAETGYIVTDTIYDALRNIEATSLPYAGTGLARTAATTDADLLIEYVRDALKRPVEIISALGTEYIAYDQWKESVTNKLGNLTDHIKDAFNRLETVVEHNGSDTATTTYAWRVDDLLIKITDADLNVRGLGYNGRGDRIELEDLHSPADTTFGVWTFEPDLAGNTGTTTNPNGQTIVTPHDAINRNTATDNLGTAGVEIARGYDTCENGIGRLCSATSTDAVFAYRYGYSGATSAETKTILGTTYTTEFERDRQDNETLTIYPDKSEVKFTRNDAGKLEDIKQREDGATFTTIINDFDYAEHGPVNRQEHQNGVVTTKTFDDTKEYQLTLIETATSSGMGGAGLEHATIEQAFFSAAASTTVNEEVVPEPIEPVVETATTTEFAIVIEEADEIVVALEKASTTKTTTPDVITDEPASTKSKTKDTGKYKDKGDTFELKLNNKAKAKIEKDAGAVSLTSNAATIAVRYDDIDAPAEYDDKADKIKWKDAKQELHAYELPAGEYMENGGFELEVLLTERPEKEEFFFPLEGDDNLDFYYQPALSEEPSEGETCTETECVDDETDEVSRTRPENIVGSYAVYQDGQKVFHILRPSIKDADGNKVWGELEYENGELSVTVPSDFLDKATYPVLVDPTFGYTTVGGSDQSVVSRDFRGSLFTTPSDYSSFDSLDVYCFTSTSNYDVKAVIVDHSTLDIVSNGVSNAVNCNTTGAWKTPTFATAPTLSASTDYILGVVSDSSRVRLKYDSGATNQGHEDSTNSFDTPEDLGSAYHDNNEYSIYITYSTGGGGGNGAPTAPTSIETEGSTNPTNVTDSTPELTAVYNDPDTNDQADNYRIEVDDNSNFASPIWNSGKTSMSALNEGSRSAAVSYAGSALASSTTYYVRYKFWDDDDTEGAWSTETATFSLAAGGSSNSAPTAPTSLEAEVQTNPTNITDSTPEFSAIFNDPDSGDVAGNYRIQVSTSTSFANPVWNSGKQAMTNTTEGNRSPVIEYSGTALASSTTYYWRIKFWDDEDAAGAWSSETATFSLAAGTPPPPSTPKKLQWLSYLQDAGNNFLEIVDRSLSTGDATTTATYDDRDRILTAIQVGGINPFNRTYDPDRLGNLLNKSDIGDYLYEGDEGTSKANPHAATSIDGDPLTYDANGNNLTYNGQENTWTYRNELRTAGTGNSTTTYGYDHTGQRVSKDVVETTAGGGSGSLEFSDAFDDSSDLPLDQHTPNVGGGWTHLINIGSCDIELDVSDGELSAGPSSCSSSDGGLYRTNSQATHADVELSVLQVDGDTNDDTNIFACRIQDANNMYAVEWNERDSALYKRVSGTWTQLDSSTTDIADGSTVTMICDGSSISFEDDGTTLLSATDTSITSAGYGGLGMGAVITSGNDVSSQDLDDFTMTTLGGGGSSNATTTTVYVNGLYEVADGEITKHIYAGDTLVATVEGSGNDAEIFHAHLDHLGSTHVMTDENAGTVQALGYYPYGAERVDVQSATHNQLKRFTGHDYDEETGEIYMKARYYDGDTGRFSSVDPYVFKDLTTIINDPQLLNTYGYARNNPLKYDDPNGELPQPVENWTIDRMISGQRLFNPNQQMISRSDFDQAAYQMTSESALWNKAVSNPEAAGLAVGVAGAASAIPMAAGVANMATIHYGSVGISYIGKMGVGAAAYEYGAYNALRSIPEMVSTYSDFEVADANTWTAPIMNTASMHLPGALGEQVGAFYDLTTSLRQGALDLGLGKQTDEVND